MNKSISQRPYGAQILVGLPSQGGASLALHPANEDLSAGAPARAIFHHPSGVNFDAARSLLLMFVDSQVPEAGPGAPSFFNPRTCVTRPLIAIGPR